MSKDYLGIPIPDELQQYKKNVVYPKNENNIVQMSNFGVKVVKDEFGNPLHAEYYSDYGELLKKIFYKGSSISTIEHYRNAILYSQEEYKEGLLVRELTFNNNGEITSTVKYNYNRVNKITAIRKSVKDSRYDVEYGYDELNRVNSRTLKYNNEVIEQQNYRYDILDRIVEYKDKTQIITVHKINQNNDLVCYTVTDNAGNTMAVVNKFLCKEYIGTELDFNGHKTTVKDKCYVDNIILKKPVTTKDDLDFAMSGVLKKFEENRIEISTKRYNNKDIIEKIIGTSVNPKTRKILPISLRKIQLLSIAV